MFRPWWQIILLVEVIVDLHDPAYLKAGGRRRFHTHKI
jgi:hypothetical protein